ncbi:MAG TPA: hypothetical protein VG755_09230 [Nannocystaceae bacterium]|nr:hypothetical protein [Nannocystaceae bacterium]
MVRSTKLVLALIPALATPLGCDDGGLGDPMAMREAEAGWFAANHAVALAEPELLERIDTHTRGDILVRCLDGGRMRLVGEENDANDFELTAMFEDCIDEGVMIGGELNIVASVELGDAALPEDGGAGSLFVAYDGQLRLDGDAEGSCAIDVQVHAPAVSYSELAGIGVEVEGSVCGHDAYAVIHGQGHR